jgi:hypothetical protein
MVETGKTICIYEFGVYNIYCSQKHHNKTDAIVCAMSEWLLLSDENKQPYKNIATSVNEYISIINESVSVQEQHRIITEYTIHLLKNFMHSIITIK